MTGPEHPVELGYTNPNDGIWLSCACGWERLLGFWATPERAMALTDQHRREVRPTGGRIHCVDCHLELVSFHNGHWRDGRYGSYQCDGEVVRTGRKYHVPPPGADTGQLDPERGEER